MIPFARALCPTHQWSLFYGSNNQGESNVNQSRGTKNRDGHPPQNGRRPKTTTKGTGRVASMKKIVTTTVTLAVLAISISSAQAAINITEATIQNGSVSISGNQAPRNAAIWWEGKATPSTSKNSGAFHLDTTNLPVDCVGRLQIGTEQRDVVSSLCTGLRGPFQF